MARLNRHYSVVESIKPQVDTSADIEAFKARGGQIQQIPIGATSANYEGRTIDDKGRVNLRVTKRKEAEEVED